MGRSRVTQDRRSALTGERGTFTRDPAHSVTLPSRFYTDVEVQELERERIFKRSWIYVGHRGELRGVGSYFVTAIAGQCLFVLRDESGCRAFFNVCQHRAHELLEGCGRLKRTITCPYHGWTYGLDGALVSARFTERLKAFDPMRFGLRELRLAETAGLLFVTLSAETPPFEEEMEGLEATFVDHLPALRDFETAYRFDYDIAANWKVVVDNFSEGYHIPVAHRKLSKVLDIEASNEAIVRPRFAAYKSRSLEGYDGFKLQRGQPYVSWTIWPNLCLLSQPGSENLIVIRMSPDGVERCAERVDILAPKGKPSANLEAVKALFADHFNKEDIAIVESVQRGLNSMGYDQGRYVAGEPDAWYSESGLHRFHTQIIEALYPDR